MKRIGMMGLLAMLSATAGVSAAAYTVPIEPSGRGRRPRRQAGEDDLAPTVSVAYQPVDVTKLSRQQRRAAQRQDRKRRAKQKRRRGF